MARRALWVALVGLMQETLLASEDDESEAMELMGFRLGALAALLPVELMEDALATAQTIEDREVRMGVLTILGLRLPEAGWERGTRNSECGVRIVE